MMKDGVTTMGAREVFASWLGWFTVSQSNTISWENNYDDGLMLLMMINWLQH